MNDIDVDTSVFYRASNDIKKTVRVLLGCAEALLKNINYASKEFTSINYDRTKEVVIKVVSSLNMCTVKVDKLIKFLNQLDDETHKYLNIRIGD